MHAGPTRAHAHQTRPLFPSEPVAASAVYGDSDTDEDSEGEDQVAPLGPKNQALAVGFNHDRSFVVRGNDIGVFTHTDDDQLKFSTAIRKIMTPKGKAFSPRQVRRPLISALMDSS